MNKQIQIVLFMAAATLFNIVVTLICLGILIALYTVLLVPHISEENSFLGIPLLFIISMIMAFFIYRQVLKRYLKNRKLN